MNPIQQRADRAWRLVATGLCFASFGLGGVALSLSIFPLIRLLTWNQSRRRRRMQLAMHHTMRMFVWMMKSLGLLSYTVRGRPELLAPGQLVVANHPSLIDVVFIISLMPGVDCIVKEGLWRNPFLRWPVSWAGYIANTAPEQLIANCAQGLRSGRSLIVFPEGTRTVPGQPLNFKRGAAQIALAAGCPIRPVRIRCHPPTLTKSEKWYQIPPRRPHWQIEVGAAILPAEFATSDGETQPLAARRLTRRLLERLGSAL
ncbi:MAG: lysophospholipid acyltransferase family protein [Panacagrimonas sp.]